MKISHHHIALNKSNIFRLIGGLLMSVVLAVGIFGLFKIVLADDSAPDASIAKPEVVLANAFDYIDRGALSEERPEILLGSAFTYHDLSSRENDEFTLGEAFTYLDFRVPSVENPEESLAGAFSYIDHSSQPRQEQISEEAYEYVGPEIYNVMPSSVSAFGGDEITIFGSFLEEGNAVYIDDVQLEIITESSSAIRVLAPAHAPGAADVRVVGQFGESTVLQGGLVYQFESVIESITPTRGPAEGGQEVIITGKMFSDKTQQTVEIAETEIIADVISYDPETGDIELKLTTLPHNHGKVAVSIIDYGGQKVTLPSAYEYIAAPEITSVTPSSGLTTGGDTVTITGAGFENTDSTKVFLGDAEISGAIVDDNTITITVPPNAPGSFDIAIEDEFGQRAVLENAYTYDYPAPVITGVSPSRGPVSGGQVVNVEGVYFYSPESTETTISTLSNVTSVTSGEGFACAIINKRVQCWGRNTYGQLGIGNTEYRSNPQLVDTTGTLMNNKDIEQISAGDNHVLALDSNKVMYAWGLNSSGQLGDNTRISRSKPVAVNTGGINNSYSNIPRYISAGGNFSIMNTSSIYFYGWGGDSFTGGGTTRPASLSYNSGPPLDAGHDHVIYPGSAGHKWNYSWGRNTYGQLGRGNKNDVNITSLKSNFTNHDLTYVHAGKYTSAGINSLNQVLIWGGSYPASATSPQVINPLANKSINKIKCSMTSCIASSSNKIFRYDLVGVDAGRAKEVNILNGKNIRDIEISPNGQQYYAIATDGQMHAWSGNPNMNVLFDEINVDGFLNGYNPVLGGNSISVSTPPHDPGLVDVSVISPDGEKVTLPNSYEYISGPEINSVSPSRSHQSGGDTITIIGSNFTEQTKIKLGNNYVSPTFINQNTLTFVAPASTQPGTLDVTVEDEFGQTATLENGFTYMLAEYTLSSISPVGGPMAGGTTVTIRGSNFVVKSGGGTWYDVHFGDQPAASVTYVNATTLRAVSPANEKMERVDISVGAGGLGERLTLEKAYTYYTDSYQFVNDPLSLAATEPGKMVLEARDKDGNLAIAGEDMEIAVSSGSAGGFFARSLEEDVSTRWDYSTVIIPAGQSSVEFYYRDANQGEPTITARVIGSAVATQKATIGSRFLFEVTGVSNPTNIGIPSSVTVRVVDWQGNPLTGYTGRINFSSTDQAAILPPSYTMKASDNGVKTFVNGVTMRTQGDFCVVAQDSSNSTIRGEQCEIAVGPASVGAISKLAIITPEQSFPSNGYSSPITIQTQAEDGAPIAVTEDAVIYLYSSSETGQFSLDNESGWSSNKPFSLTIPRGLTAVSVYYRDTVAGESQISARDLTTDAADNGLPGDFGWFNSSQNIISGVGAPTRMKISGPERLDSNNIGEYTVELRDDQGNPVTAENDIQIRVGSDSDSGRFYILPDMTPRFGPIEITVPAGSNNTKVGYSDTAENSQIKNAQLKFVDGRPMTESVRLRDEDFEIQVGLGDPYAWLIQPIGSQSIRKFNNFRVDTIDEFGNITYTDEDLSGQLTSDKIGRFESDNIEIAIGEIGANGRYLALEIGEQTLRIEGGNLMPAIQTFEATPINVKVAAPSKVEIKENAKFRVSFTDQDGQAITLDEATNVSLTVNAESSEITPEDIEIEAGQSVFEVNYLDSELGDRTLSAESESEGIESGEVQFEVVPGVYNPNPDPDNPDSRGGIEIISSPQTLRAGERKPISFVFKDNHGTPTVLSEPVQVRFSSNSNIGRFFDSENTPLEQTIFTVPAETREFTVYYYDETAGQPEITIHDIRNSTVRDNQLQTVIADIPSGIEFITDPQAVVKNTSSQPIGAHLVDRFGNLAQVESDGFVVNLDDQGSGGEFSRDGDNWGQNSISLNQGTQTFVVYYRNQNLGAHTLTFSASGITPDSQVIDVIEGYAAQVAIIPAQNSVLAGEVLAVEIQLQTEDGRPTVATKDIRLNLQGDVSFTAEPFNKINSLQFSPREGTKTIYFRSNIAGTNVIEATDSADPAEIADAQASIEVLAGEFAKFGISPNSQNVPLDAVSSEYTVSTYDVFGNVQVVQDETSVYLHANNTTTEFAQLDDLNWGIEQIGIVSGGSTAKFVARGNQFVETTITASDEQALDNPDTGIGNATARLNIVSQPIDRIRFLTSNRVALAGEASEEITIQLEQADGTPAIQNGQTIYLSSNSEYTHRFMPIDSTNAISSIEIEPGSAQGTFRYQGNYTGTHILTAKTNLSDTAISASQVIRIDSNIVDNMYFVSPPRTVDADDSSNFIRVGFRDQYNNHTTLDRDLAISLRSNSSTAKFSESSSDWQDIEIITAKSGSEYIDFHVKDITSGTWQMNLAGAGLSDSINQSYTVNAGAPVSYKLVGRNNEEHSDMAVKGAPYQLRLTLYDEFGNTTTARTTTRFDLESSASAGRFTPARAVIYAGSSSAIVRYVNDESGENNITVTHQSLGENNFELTYTEGEVSRLRFTPASATIRAGQAQKLELKSLNENGIEVVVKDDLTINLSSNQATGEFLESSSGDVISQVIMKAGESTVEVFYRQTKSENATVSATSQDITTANANISVLSEDVAYMELTNQPYGDSNPLQIGQNASFRVQLYDIYGNIATVSSALDLYATSNSGVEKFTVPTGSSSVNYRLIEDIPGDYQITISTNPDLEGTQILSPVAQEYKVVYGAPTNFVFDKTTYNLERGAIMQSEVQLVNAYGREVPAGEDGATIRLRGFATGGNAGELSLSSDGGYTSSIDLTVPSGESRAEFYYRNNNASINSKSCYINSQTDVRNCYTTTTYNHYVEGTVLFTAARPQKTMRVRMQYGAAVRLNFTTPESIQTAQHPSSKMTVQRVNQYGIPVPTSADQRIYLRSSNGGTGEFSQRTQEGWGANYVIMRNNDSTVDFYYRDSQVGNAVITAADLLPLDPDLGVINAIQNVQIERQEVDHLFVTNISDPQSAGTASSVIVIARDKANYIVNWYDGMIRFSSDDPAAILPQDYSFDPEVDKGSKTFTNQVAFRTAGEKIVYVTDVNNSDLTGSQTDITVENGNTEPMASLEITQPLSPTSFISGTVSPPITIVMKDAEGNITNAQAGGQPIKLSSSSWSAKFSLSPNGPWSSELITDIPDGLSFLNFYYQDETLGKARITGSDWLNGEDSSDLENAQLDVEISRVGLSGESKVYSQNVFGVFEGSKYLFSAKETGEIIGRSKNSFNSYSLQDGQSLDTLWRLNWSQGVNRLDNQLINEKIYAAQIDRDIKTVAGQPDFYATAESTDASFDQPESVVSLEHTIRTSSWKINLNNPEYAIIDDTYQATIQTFERNLPQNAGRVSVKVLPAGSLDANAAVFGTIVSSEGGEISVEIPAEILNQLGDQFQLLVEIVDTDNNILAQALSQTFEVVEEIPEIVEPEIPVDPTDPDDNSETPDENNETEPENQPVDPIEDDGGTISPDSLPEIDEVEDDVADIEESENIPIPGSTDKDGSDDSTPNTSAQNNNLYITAPAALLGAQTFFLVVALIREAYKEVVRVYRMRKELARLKAISKDKDKFLSLSSHYLRSPIALLEAAASISPSVRPTIRPIIESLRAKSNQLIEEDIQPELDLIKNPDIAKATRSALKSIFFWLPLIVSVILTIGINLVMIGLYQGAIKESIWLYVAIFAVLMLTLGLFWLRTNYINQERENMQEATKAARRILFASRNRFTNSVKNDLANDIMQLGDLAHKVVLDNKLASQSIRESALSLKNLHHKLRVISQLDGAPIRPTVLTGKELFRYIMSRYDGQLRAKNIDLQFSEAGVDRFNQDDLIIRNTLDSLIEQAIKTTPEGGEIKVNLSAKGELMSIDIDSQNLADIQVESVDEGESDIKLDLYFDQLLMKQIGGEVEVDQLGRKLQMKFKNI